jgi:hypothetical protein
MKHQTLICFIAIQAFVRTAALLGVGSTTAGAIDDVALGHVRAATYVVDQAAPGAADTNP